jgi:FKBP-type peptidyl-prolyl cis-trans isomerase (trigger factor)
MKLKTGIELLQEREGEGRAAEKYDQVIYNLKIFLNQGEEVPLNQRQAEHLPAEMIRKVDGTDFTDHKMILGRRRAIAAVEYSLIGMKKGGYRKIRASPHLAYREKGLPGLIPPNAVLILELWLREIISDYESNKRK